MQTGPEFNPEELVTKLSDETLTALSRACLYEMTERGIIHQKLTRVGLIDPFSTGSQPDPSSLADNRLIINHEERFATLDGKLLDINGIPFNVLAVLAINADHFVSPKFLLQMAWGQEHDFDKDKIKFGLMRLRHRLGEEMGDINTGVVRTVKRTGYIALSSLKNPTILSDIPT